MHRVPHLPFCCLQVEIGNMDISLKYFEEVYTTEHWMVRVYRVLDKCALRMLPRAAQQPGMQTHMQHFYVVPVATIRTA